MNLRKISILSAGALAVFLMINLSATRRAHADIPFADDPIGHGGPTSQDEIRSLGKQVDRLQAQNESLRTELDACMSAAHPNGRNVCTFSDDNGNLIGTGTSLIVNDPAAEKAKGAALMDCLSRSEYSMCIQASRSVSCTKRYN